MAKFSLPIATFALWRLKLTTHPVQVALRNSANLQATFLVFTGQEGKAQVGVHDGSLGGRDQW